MEQTLDQTFEWETVATVLGKVENVMDFFMDETERKQVMHQVEQQIVLPCLAKKKLTPEQELFRNALCSQDVECFYQTAVQLYRRDPTCKYMHKLLRMACTKNTKAQQMSDYLGGFGTDLLVSWDTMANLAFCTYHPFFIEDLQTERLSEFSNWDVIRETFFYYWESTHLLDVLRCLAPHFEHMHTLIFAMDTVPAAVVLFLNENGYASLASRNELPYEVRKGVLSGTNEWVFVYKDYVRN